MKPVYISGAIIAALLVICFLQQNQLRGYVDNSGNTAHVIDSLTKVADSLHAENYPCQIELNRYRIAYEIFLERNPKAADQYGDIISNETE